MGEAILTRRAGGGGGVKGAQVEKYRVATGYTVQKNTFIQWLAQEQAAKSVHSAKVQAEAGTCVVPIGSGRALALYPTQMRYLHARILTVGEDCSVTAGVETVISKVTGIANKILCAHLMNDGRVAAFVRDNDSTNHYCVLAVSGSSISVVKAATQLSAGAWTDYHEADGELIFATSGNEYGAYTDRMTIAVYRYANGALTKAVEKDTTSVGNMYNSVKSIIKTGPGVYLAFWAACTSEDPLKYMWFTYDGSELVLGTTQTAVRQGEVTYHNHDMVKLKQGKILLTFGDYNRTYGSNKVDFPTSGVLLTVSEDGKSVSVGTRVLLTTMLTNTGNTTCRHVQMLGDRYALFRKYGRDAASVFCVVRANDALTVTAAENEAAAQSAENMSVGQMRPGEALVLRSKSGNTGLEAYVVPDTIIPAQSEINALAAQDGQSGQRIETYVPGEE